MPAWGGGGEGDVVLGGVGFVGGNDAPEVVCVLHWVAFDIHQNGSKGFDGGGDVVIGRLAIDCGKYFRGLFEGEGGHFGR